MKDAPTISRLTVTLAILLVPFLVFAQTPLNGTINTNTTLSSAGNPYVVENDVTIAEDVTLTLQPGVIIKFNDHYDDMFVNGTLRVLGTASNPVFFTSIHDDAHGGDTNGNGIATVPEADQWGAIWFNASSTNNLLDHAWIGYGGGFATSAMVNAYTSNLIIRNSTLAWSAERGVYGQDASPRFEDNQFINNNTDGIYFHSLDPAINLILTNNVFTGNNHFAVLADLQQEAVDILLTNNSSTGSSHNGFGFWGSLSGESTFDANPGFPFIVHNDFTVLEGASLTITPGTTVKFNDHYDDFFVKGSLHAAGTASAPIVFTALADDAHAGDTNGDGTATEAAPDQWGALWFDQSSSSSLLDHTWFGYGGGFATSAIINTYSSDLIIRNSTVAWSAERGVYSQAASPRFENNQFISNNTDGVYFYHLDPTIDLEMTGNVFTDNINFAVLADLYQEAVDILLTNNSSTGSAHNGFGFFGSLGGESTFDANPGFPFIVHNDFTVLEGASLTITPGTTVKFNDHYDDFFVKGSLYAAGTASEPIVFTALADDAHAGDTNGDGTATEAAPDQWGALWFDQASSSSLLKHTWFGYGGGFATSAMINTHSSDLTVRNSTIAYSAERGVYCQDVSPLFEDNHFIENTTDGIYFYSLDPAIDLEMTGNVFTGNNNFSVLASLQEESVNVLLNGNSSSGSAHSGFAFFGSIAGDVVFDANPGFPFIVQDDVTVMEDATLTFIAGSTIKFNDHYDDINVNGSLVAVGTPDEPIVFTCLADDAHGGDTNGDENSSEPEPDQWGGIWFNPSSIGNALNNAWIGYGGGFATSAMLNVYTSGVAIQNSTIAWSAERGLYVQDASPYLEGNHFKGNATDGIYYYHFDELANPVLVNNTFTDNNNFAVLANMQQETIDLLLTGNSSTGSAHNGFALFGSVNAPVLFSSNPGFPFIIQDDLTVLDNASLTLSPGTTIKFNDHYDDLFINGSLTAIGTAAEPIVFTSLADDAHEGDTNGDGSDTEPAGDQWGGIWFGENSTANQLEHCWLGYGGGFATSAIVNVYTSSLSIKNSIITHSPERGIYLQQASPYLEANIIRNSDVGLYAYDQSLPTLVKNDFIDNNSFGVFNADGTVEVDARNNWWGDQTGPYHPVHNPAGLGNEVSNHVLFEPWLTQPGGNPTAIEDVAGEICQFRIYPNPVTDAAMLSLQLTEASRVRIDIVDARGKVLETIGEGSLVPGEHQFQWRAVRYPAGNYWCRVMVEGQIISRPVIKN
jgi:plastocyanin